MPCAVRLQRFTSDGKATAAVETALLALPFVILLAAVVELAAILVTEITLQSRVQTAGRMIRIGQITRKSDFIQAFCANPGILRDCDKGLHVHADSRADFGLLGSTIPEYQEVGPDSTAFNTGTANQAVAVIVTYDWTFMLPLLKPISNTSDGNALRLHGISVFLNEPPG